MKNLPENDMSGDARLGDRLSLLRTKLLEPKLTQGEMAKRLETNQSTLSHYEAGHRMPDGEFLARLQAKFCVNVNWLLCGRGHWQLEHYDRPGQDAGAALHPDDLLLVGQLARRLQEKHEPSKFSKAVVVMTQDDLDRRPSSARGQSFRALPYTSDMAVIGLDPLPEGKTDGLFVIRSGRHQSLKHLRCLQLPDNRFSPCFPRGSILAVDVSRKDPKVLDGKVVLADLKLDGERNLLKLRRDKEYLLFEPINPDPNSAIQVVEADKVQRYSIIGRVVWAWHRVA